VVVIEISSSPHYAPPSLVVTEEIAFVAGFRILENLLTGSPGTRRDVGDAAFWRHSIADRCHDRGRTIRPWFIAALRAMVSPDRAIIFRTPLAIFRPFFARARWFIRGVRILILDLIERFFDCPGVTLATCRDPPSRTRLGDRWPWYPPCGAAKAASFNRASRS
jgi:hypothetical protein